MSTAVEAPPQADEKPRQKVRTGKGGRPKKADIPPPGQGAKPFPEPPKSRFPNGSIPPEQFFEYRAQLPAEFIPRMSFYFYREWPVLDFLKNWTTQQLAELKAKKRRHPIKYIGQYADVPTDEWRNFILRCHGSGKYKLVLNDCGAPGVTSGEICKTFVEINDAEILPIVEDLTILADVPENNKFLNDLRMKGVAIPGDKAGKEDGDMAAVETVEKLSTALIDATKSKPSENGNNALLAELMKTAETRFSEQRKIDLEQRRLDDERQRRELDEMKAELKAAREAAAKKTDDPMSMTTAVINMAKQIGESQKPQGPGFMEAFALFQKMMEGQAQQQAAMLQLIQGQQTIVMQQLTKRLDDAEKDAREAREKLLQQAIQPPQPATAAAAGQTPTGAMKDAMDIVRTIFKMKSEIDDKIPADNGTSTGNPWVDLAAETLPRVLDTVDKFAPVFRAGAAPQPQVSGVPAVIQQPQQQQPQSEQDMFGSIVRQLRPQLIQALQQGIPGSRFGAGLIMQTGSDMYYRQVTQQGEASVVAFLGSAPEVWGELQRAFGPVKLQQFIGEFCNGEQVQAYLNAMAQQQQAPPAPPVPQQQPMSMPTPSSAASTAPPRQPVIVDAPPVVQTPAPPPSNTGRPKVIRPDGSEVKVMKPNGTTEANPA